jgi:hypothetical protein
MAAPRRQFCVRGHDTFAAGRDMSGRCNVCRADSRREAHRARQAEALRLQSQAREEQVVRLQRERERHERAILRRGGPEALALLQQRAFEAGRCGWELSETEVCQRPANRDDFVFCRMHSRQVVRGGRSEAEGTLGRLGCPIPEL